MAYTVLSSVYMSHGNVQIQKVKSEVPQFSKENKKGTRQQCKERGIEFRSKYEVLDLKGIHDVPPPVKYPHPRPRMRYPILHIFVSIYLQTWGVTRR